MWSYLYTDSLCSCNNSVGTSADNTGGEFDSIALELDLSKSYAFFNSAASTHAHCIHSKVLILLQE